MKELESCHQDLHLKEIFKKISIKTLDLDDRSIDDVFRRIDTLPRRITIEKGRDVHDYVFSVIKNENYGYDDAFCAMYVKRNAKYFNNQNFLFSVCGSSFSNVLKRVLFVYESLIKEGVIKGRLWKCNLKNIDFSNYNTL